ncbi:lipid-A-disaccharide synthase [Neosynechococcus sphagnicola]|uniref:lipid-A-disaccharide synthase n=1 Tax=Neosynechococcus sphagnicola TaxID=1501145 RepID=UPI0023BAE34E|nr:lipid-A-disaccharide synthase [Neosynechococcus sphagnicola]
MWSLNQRNTRRIVQFTDQLLAVFPGEAHYYQQQGAAVTWVGHPLLDQMSTAPSREQARLALGIAPNQWAIALVPASRQQELQTLLPVILEAARQLQAQIPNTDPQQPLFWIPLSLEAYRAHLQQAIAAAGLRAQLVPDRGHPQGDWLRRCAIAAADLAITKSGTVNLEIALMQVPQVVIYRVSPFTAWVAQHLLKFSIPFMAPPNLVTMRPIVPELLQGKATAPNIVRESLDLLLNPTRRQQIQQDYQAMRQSLGEPGVADRAALAILKLDLLRQSK